MGKPVIVCAATKFIFNDEIEPVIICSPRHWDITMHKLYQILDEYVLAIKTDEVQGFVDQFGVFYDRKDAYRIALENNQIVRTVGGDNGVLYSENLY